ncbi:hypothetical protein TNCV_3680731 [Trichonephila clavipes]|nr:hypothetical protein TNCV_3680731 [Trichonephila clavipes]
MPVVSRSFERAPHTDNSTHIPPVLKDSKRSQERPISLPLPPTYREDLRLFYYLEHSHATDTMHLQTFMPSSGFKPRSYGTTVSISSYYFGWVALKKVFFDY